jgi:hypothetical protein
MHMQTPGQQGHTPGETVCVQQASDGDWQAAQSVAARPPKQSARAGRGAGRSDDWQSHIASRAAG